MKNRDDLTQRITEDIETIDEMYQQVRFNALTPQQQELYLRHLEDQFDAVPSYLSRYTANQD